MSVQLLALQNVYIVNSTLRLKIHYVDTSYILRYIISINCTVENPNLFRIRIDTVVLYLIIIFTHSFTMENGFTYIYIYIILFSDRVDSAIRIVIK
jgi:NDP-sugar pyrophosphorylase family protein